MTYLISQEKNKRFQWKRNEIMKIIHSVNTWSDLLRRKVKGKTNQTSRTLACRQRLVLGMEFKACVVLVRMDPD